jgi:replication factor C large subunit
MDMLAKADVYRGRVKETQDWTFLRYVIDLMTAGVASSWSKKSAGWTPFKFPERIKTASFSKEERMLLSEIGRRIGRKCHLSSSRAVREVLPYLRVIFQNNPKMAKGIARWLDLTDEMIAYISGEQ